VTDDRKRGAEGCAAGAIEIFDRCGRNRSRLPRMGVVNNHVEPCRIALDLGNRFGAGSVVRDVER
jgi:hypothetical protein